MKFSKDSEALNFLSRHNNIKVDAKLIKVVGSLSGLSSCSAVDYLDNHSSYNIVLTKDNMVEV